MISRRGSNQLIRLVDAGDKHSWHNLAGGDEFAAAPHG